MKSTTPCPEPLPLARLSRGEGTDAEFAALADHLAHCAACRAEWGALEALNARESAGEWLLTSGAETDIPDTLWRSIEAARGVSTVPAAAAAVAAHGERGVLLLGLRMGSARAAVSAAAGAVEGLVAAASRALRSIDWLSLLSGSAELHPVAAAPVRGAAESAAAEVPAVRLTSGRRDILVRRSGERLTLVLTESGAPVAGCRVRLDSPDGARDERTDPAGVVVFRSLPAGDYRIQIEEAQP